MDNIIKNSPKILLILLVGIIAWLSNKFWQANIRTNYELASSIEAHDVRISSKVGGRISKIFIKEGDFIKKDQKLIILEGDELIEQLSQAKATLEKSKHDLKDLQNGSRPQEINQAQAQTLKTKAILEETKLRYNNIESDYKRLQSLYNEGAISKQSFEKIETDKNIAKKAIDSAEQEHIKAKEFESLVIEGARKEQIKSLSSQVKLNEAKVKEFEKYVSELIVTAPLNGEVSSFDLKIGELIKQSQPLLTITDLNDIYVRVYIPSSKLSKIKLNERVELIADSYPNEKFEGTIAYIGAKAEFTPRNVQTPEERSKIVYPIKIQIQNIGNKLREGMYITVKL